MWKYTCLDHPFKTFIPTGVKTIVVGTFPTRPSNFQFPFYYSGKDNRFWAVMESVYGLRFKHHSGNSAVEERKEFLASKQIGITDMLLKCYRLAEKSQDKHLHPILLNDIFSILDQHDSINCLLLTSRTEVYGALGLLNMYFQREGKTFEFPVRNRHNILEGGFRHNNRDIEILVPISPSPSAEKSADLETLIQMYTLCLIDVRK
jgi:G:T/U-mismatch repair DNA glycosylase